MFLIILIVGFTTVSKIGNKSANEIITCQKKKYIKKRNHLIHANEMETPTECTKCFIDEFTNKNISCKVMTNLQLLNIKQKKSIEPSWTFI